MTRAEKELLKSYRTYVAIAKRIVERAEYEAKQKRDWRSHGPCSSAIAWQRRIHEQEQELAKLESEGAYDE